jgi:tight adherence protein C
MNLSLILQTTSYGLLAAGSATTLYVLGATPSVIAPSLGERGRRRRLAMADGGMFAAAEPMVRKVSGWIARFQLDRQRAHIEQMLRSSGYALGITADELLGMMLLSAVAAGLLSVLITGFTSFSTSTWFLISFALGCFIPYLQFQELVKNRRKLVNRGLPPAIDLVALCMGAGSDFPGAMRFVVGELVNERDPTREEISHILQQLEVGHTRAYALSLFAQRIPTEAVRDFVSAVVQAEEKGTPLADVLQIQARMLRMRRSVAAEEAAARAAVMLIGPLMLQLCAILIILFGPFLINGLGF